MSSGSGKTSSKTIGVCWLAFFAIFSGHPACADEAAKPGAVAGAPGGYVRPSKVTIPPMPPSNAGAFLKGLARDPDGRRVLLDDGQGNRLVVDDDDEPGPQSARDRCVKLLSWCQKNHFKPDASMDTQARSAHRNRVLDACWVSVPTCKTGTPWEESAACCPSSCVERYENARTSGVESSEADLSVLFRKPRCTAGLDEELGEGP